jgi:hypothetical protein
MLSEKFLNDNLDKNIKLNLKNGFDVYFDESDISLIAQTKEEERINPYLDSEKIRFKFEQPTPNLLLSFSFRSGNTLSFNTTYKHAGFTQTELNQNQTSFINSFYAMEVYDSVNSKIQNLLSTTYIKPITSNRYTGSTNIRFLTTDEQTKILIPKTFIAQQTGTSVNVYIKFSFYNAKTGKIIPFFDNLFIPKSGETIFYKLTQLNITGRTYAMNIGFLDSFKEFSNTGYTTNINNRFDNIQLKSLVFPTGTTFTASGTYI